MSGASAWLPCLIWAALRAGSAHAVLGPYWAARLGGKQQLAAQQCSQRCGELWLDLAAEPGRVVVSGQAVVVLRGELELPDEEDD